MGYIFVFKKRKRPQFGARGFELPVAGRASSQSVDVRDFLAPIKISGASFRRGDFAPREPEFGVEFWDANF